MTGIRSRDDSQIIDRRPDANLPTSRAYNLTRPRLLAASQVAGRDVTNTRRNNASATANLTAAYIEQQKRRSKAV